MEGLTLTVQMTLTPIEKGLTHTRYEKLFKGLTLSLVKPTRRGQTRLFEGRYESVKDGEPLFRVASQKKASTFTHYAFSNEAQVMPV
jgi:hypothetical protein